MRKLLPCYPIAFAICIFASTNSLAQSCNFSFTGLNFGAVDTLTGANIDVTSTLGVTCSGPANRTLTICPNIGAGTGGASATERRMHAGGNYLSYQLYQDATHTTIWGSAFWAYPHRAPGFRLQLDAAGRGTMSTTVYGRLFGGQELALRGNYRSDFSGNTNPFTYRYDASRDCNAPTGQTAHPRFSITASVQNNCHVTAQDIDFGSSGIIRSNIDAEGQVSVVCTPGTAYRIGLNNGITGSSPNHRRMTLGDSAITYGLYRDSTRTLVWGEQDQDTAVGSGDGSKHILPVYGRVPPQPTPEPGEYSDTIVVTITY